MTVFRIVHHLFEHLRSRFYIYPPNRRMFGLPGNRSGDQNHFSSPGSELLSQGKPHLTRRVIPDKTDRIDLFISRPCRQQYLFTQQITLSFKITMDRSDDLFRFSHSSLAHQTACQFTGSRLDPPNPVTLKNVQVLSGSRMTIHIQVHRRSNHYRTFGRQIGRQQQIIGYTVGHLSQGIRCRRSNQV